MGQSGFQVEIRRQLLRNPSTEREGVRLQQYLELTSLSYWGFLATKNIRPGYRGIPDKKFHLRHIFSRYGNHPL